MLKDQRDLLLEFNARNVKFLIIGGYAYSHYTEPRATKDLDILIATSDENVQLVYKALAHFGAPLAGVAPQDFQEPKSFIESSPAATRLTLGRRGCLLRRHIARQSPRHRRKSGQQ